LEKSDYTASTSNSDTSQHEVNPPPSDVGVITNTRYERNKEAQPLQKFPEDISKGEIHIPVQPKLNTYPWKYFGSKTSQTSVSKFFFAEFSWLEYSV